jgi:hypothetical protein
LASISGVEKAVQAAQTQAAKAALRGRGVNESTGAASGSKVTTASTKVGSKGKAGGVTVTKMHLRKIRLRG